MSTLTENTFRELLRTRNDMQILALDIARRTGWAHSNGTSGVKDFGFHPDEVWGARWERAIAWLSDVVPPNTKAIAYDNGFVRGEAATHQHHALRTVIELIAFRQQCRTIPIRPNAVKKFACAHGHASKQSMVVSARKRWPAVEIIDHNHADALWLLAYAEAKLATEAEAKL